MKIGQILESVSAGGMGTGSIATAPAKAGKMIKREKGNLLTQEDQGVEEVSLGDYRKKAAMQKAQSQMGAMFSRDPAEREKNLATFNKREKGLNRLKARDEKTRVANQQKQLADLVARLPELEAEYAAMQKRYKALGGSDWQYADREQNLTPAEREARGMEGPMNNLWRQIQAAKKSQGVAEGLRDPKDNPCWKGYKPVGTKNKGGRTVPNCVPKESVEEAGSPAQQAAIAISMKKKGQKPKNENFNGEYDDEAGMAESNLLTALRAVKGLLDTIDEKDNLPEWAQEKIAKAEMMLVGVWDYLQSQKEQGIDPEISENKKGVRAVKHTTKPKGIDAPKPRNFVAKNAVMGGAGQHKDKKKAAKQGDVKHKAKELAYESRLWSALDSKISK